MLPGAIKKILYLISALAAVCAREDTEMSLQKRRFALSETGPG
jgi:hypothetical protein